MGCFSFYLAGEVGQQVVWAAEACQELWKIFPGSILDPNKHPIFNTGRYRYKGACTVSIVVGVGDDAAVVPQTPGPHCPDVSRKPVAT